MREKDTERERERERERRKWRHHRRAKIGDEFTPCQKFALGERDGRYVTMFALKLAMNLHFPMPKIRTWRWVYTFLCQKYGLQWFFLTSKKCLMWDIIGKLRERGVTFWSLKALGLTGHEIHGFEEAELARSSRALTVQISDGTARGPKMWNKFIGNTNIGLGPDVTSHPDTSAA